MKVFTIGFTKKTAQSFFEIMKKNDVNLLIDIRLNNSSQLAGFSKGEDLRYFLKEICAIDYQHDLLFAPTACARVMCLCADGVACPSPAGYTCQ